MEQNESETLDANGTTPLSASSVPEKQCVFPESPYYMVREDLNAKCQAYLKVSHRRIDLCIRLLLVHNLCTADLQCTSEC